MSDSSINSRQDRNVDYDAVIVGAGFAGLGMLHQLREAGFSAHAFEIGDNVGGTWYWNRYPGACCDTESGIYAFAFDEELLREYQWNSRYPNQTEVLAYLNHLADRFDLRRDITLATRVTAATVDPTTGDWLVDTDDGQKTTCRYFITAAGCLSAAQLPDIPGIHSFQGRHYHTGNWPHEKVDFTGLRVGVVGTGSSGIQIIPELAKEAEQLTVFQRTPNFSIPSRNRPLREDEKEKFRAECVALREATKQTATAQPFYPLDQSALAVDRAERLERYQADWDYGGFKLLIGSYEDIITNEAANQTVADFVRDRIREVVEDPATAELLTPRDHPIGSKRPPLDQGYFETFNRPNVELVDIRSAPIREVTPRGLRTAEQDYEFDALVFATGFDAITGALSRIDIRTKDGTRLADKWADGPLTYLGLCSAGFPNMFLITGPGSPSVLANMPESIEQHVNLIIGCLQHLRANGFDRIEADQEAESQWTAHVNEVANGTLMPQANSWFVGANTPGKPRRFIPYVGGFAEYGRICGEMVQAGYKGFHLSAAADGTNSEAEAAVSRGPE